MGLFDWRCQNCGAVHSGTHRCHTASVTPAEREREARGIMLQFAQADGAHPITLEAALDAYRDAVEARVRWDQQADAEPYNRDLGR